MPALLRGTGEVFRSAAASVDVRPWQGPNTAKYHCKFINLSNAFLSITHHGRQSSGRYLLEYASDEECPAQVTQQYAQSLSAAEWVQLMRKAHA